MRAFYGLHVWRYGAFDLVALAWAHAALGDLMKPTVDGQIWFQDVAYLAGGVVGMGFRLGSRLYHIIRY